MPNQKTTKSNFQSRKGGGFISCSQFLTEQLCINMSAAIGEDLPLKFWNLPKWKVFFVKQIQAVNELLKLYDHRAILATLQDKRCKNVRSFRAPWINDILKEHQERIDLLIKQEQASVEIPKLDTNAKPRPPVGQGKSTASKLRNL